MRHQRLTILSLGGLAVAVACGCSQTRDVEFGDRPRVRNVQARVVGIDLEGVALSVDVDIENPYNVAIRTPSFRYGLDIEDNEFLRSNDNVKVDLPARRMSTINLPVNVDYRKLWETYSQLGGASEIAYSVHGSFLLNALGQSIELPIRHSGRFPVLRLPTFEPGRVRTKKASFTSAKVELDATVTNPNAFDVGCRDLSYTLRLGDVEVGRVTASSQGNIGSGRSGKLTLSGEIQGLSALQQVISGRDLGKTTILATGTIQTPYGEVRLPGLNRQ
jgi:LEA14-like dessication related protein